MFFKIILILLSLIIGVAVMGKLANFFKTLNFVNEAKNKIEVIQKNTSEDGRLSREHKEIQNMVHNSQENIKGVVLHNHEELKNELKPLNEFVVRQDERQKILSSQTLGIQQHAASLQQASDFFLTEIPRIQMEHQRLRIKQELEKEEIQKKYDDLVIDYNLLVSQLDEKDLAIQELKEEVQSLTPQPPTPSKRIG